MKRRIEDYLDILYLPHHVSPNHKRMSRENRAAQFAPFAALTGFENHIRKKEDIQSHISTYKKNKSSKFN